MKAVILAAGANSRFWPLGQGRHKCMCEVGAGKPVLAYDLEEIEKAGIKEAIIVIRENDGLTEKHLTAYGRGNLKFVFVRQPEARGMGDALLQARKALANESGFVVLNPNHINCGDMVRNMINLFESRQGEIILAGQKTSTPSDYGILELEGNRVVSIEEKPQNPKSDIRIVGIYCLPSTFLDVLTKHSEHYSFEMTLGECATAGQSVMCMEIAPDFHLFSLKYPWDLLAINRFLLDRILDCDTKQQLVKVSDFYTIFEAPRGVAVTGPVIFGSNVKFLGQSSIKGPCYIGNDVIIGDYVTIRDHTFIGNGCVIGSKTEIKNSILGNGVHTHDNFIGDSVIGENCRLGAGTITANRRVDRSVIKSRVNGQKIETGLTSLGVIMGPGTKTGINSSLMPGIKIGQNCIIGPQTLVGDDVENGHAYYAMFQINKKTIRHGG